MRINSLTTILIPTFILGSYGFGHGIPKELKYIKKYNPNFELTNSEVVDLKRNAWLAASSLCDSKQLSDWNCKSCLETSSDKPDRIITFENKNLGASGYIAIFYFTKEIVISIKNIEDPNVILTSIGKSQATYNFLNANGKEKNVKVDKNIKVDSFVLFMLDAIWPKLEDSLNSLFKMDKSYKHFQIKLVGHSVGGSIASLLLPKLSHEFNLPFLQFQLYTYGQPLTGNAKFAHYLNSLPVKILRSVNLNDKLVSFRLKDKKLEFKHHRQEFFIKDKTNKIYLLCKDKDGTLDENCSSSVKEEELEFKANYQFFNTYFNKTIAC